MDKKNNNSNSEDKPYSDSVELFDQIFAPTESDDTPDSKEDKPYSDSLELFDQIFAPTKPDETPDTKKERPAPDTTSDKTVQQKVPPKTKQGVAPPVKTLNKKTISSSQPGISKPSIKQDTPITKTKPSATGSSKIVTQKVIKKEQQKIKPQKKLVTKEAASPGKLIVSKPIPERDISVKEPPVTDKNSVKPEIEKKKPYEKSKKSLNPLIFALSIVVLVILSMFAGKVMDYDAIMDFFKMKDSLTSISEPISQDDTNKKVVSVSKDIKAPSQAEELVESKIVKSDIQGLDRIKEEEETQVNVAPILSEKSIDEVSDVIKESILSYPYSIYLGSYSSMAKVEKASSDYTEMGISLYWTELDLGEKGIWFRLFAGCFQTRKEADEFIKTWQIQGAESKNTKYANLIGIYTSEEDVSRDKADLEELGYSPYIISDTKDVFRLYTGAFYQKVRAEAQNSDLVLKGIKSELVER